jgi:tetratricopeptide (TPR) repeat protein
LELYERNYEEVLKNLSLFPEEIFPYGDAIKSVSVIRGFVHKKMRNYELAQIAYDSARVFLETHEKEYSGRFGYHIALAEAYGGLGQKEKAIKTGQLAIETYPYSEDALRGVFTERDMAIIYASIGELDLAIDLLEHVMNVPFDFESVATLRHQPWWDPLRDHPRFQALLKKYEIK